MVQRRGAGRRPKADASILKTVRLTEFQELLHTEFGVARGDALLNDHSILSLGRTGADAIEAGVDPREVWRALCAEFDVPRVRW